LKEKEQLELAKALGISARDRIRREQEARDRIELMGRGMALNREVDAFPNAKAWGLKKLTEEVNKECGVPKIRVKKVLRALCAVTKDALDDHKKINLPGGVSLFLQKGYVRKFQQTVYMDLHLGPYVKTKVDVWRAKAKPLKKLKRQVEEVEEVN
jgi:hypothetical protein